MRIALVVERFGPSSGGVEQAAWHVARELLAAGDVVHMIARVAEEEDELGPAQRLHVHKLNVPTTWQPLRVMLFSRLAAERVALLSGEIDLVYGFTRVRRQDIHRAGGGSHADFLRQTHGPRGARWRALSPRHRVLLRAERVLLADERVAVHCVSERVRDELVARHGLARERTRVIHNGVDCNRFHPSRHAQAASELRAALTNRSGPVWLLAGSGARRKGLDTAMAALAASARPDSELWVAGRDDPAHWRRLAGRLGLADRVRFLGPRSDMPVVYAAADGLLLPTRYDPFSNACLEAAASARPVVSTRTNGAMELLESAGRVVEDAEDVPAFARALDELYDEPTRLALGESGRKIAERHDWPDHARRLRALYRDYLLSRNERTGAVGESS